MTPQDANDVALLIRNEYGTMVDPIVFKRARARLARSAYRTPPAPHSKVEMYDQEDFQLTLNQVEYLESQAGLFWLDSENLYSHEVT